MPPFASRSSVIQRQREHRSNNIDNAALHEIIVSPLPASIVAPPPIESPVDSSNHRMKIDKLLRSATCFDTPNWKNVIGEGCDWYEDWCSSAIAEGHDLGPAAIHCCGCGGVPQTPQQNQLLLRPLQQSQLFLQPLQQSQTPQQHQLFLLFQALHQY